MVSSVKIKLCMLVATMDFVLPNLLSVWNVKPKNILHI